MALSTTVGGVWTLQALLGIETMPASLRLKPYVPSVHASLVVETTAGPQPLTHTAEYLSLVHAGVIDAAGIVDEAVRDWMAVIGRPDRQVVLAIRRPGGTAGRDPGASPTVAERVMVICQRRRWLAVIARDGNDMVIDAVGESDDPATQTDLMCHVLLSAMGDAEPADIDGVNLPYDRLISGLDGAGPIGRDAVTSVLSRLGLQPAQAEVLAAATRLDESAMAVAYVIDHGIGPVVHPRGLSVADTEHGRISITTTISTDGRKWVSIWPTGPAALREDLEVLLRTPRAARGIFAGPAPAAGISGGVG
jgi:hypothetical protein